MYSASERKRAFRMDSSAARGGDKCLQRGDAAFRQTTVAICCRFLSQYRATVGLARSYCVSGVCRWRDAKLPSQILAEFTDKHLDVAPIYTDDETVEIGGSTYKLNELGTIISTQHHVQTHVHSEAEKRNQFSLCASFLPRDAMHPRY